MCTQVFHCAYCVCDMCPLCVQMYLVCCVHFVLVHLHVTAVPSQHYEPLVTAVHFEYFMSSEEPTMYQLSVLYLVLV